MICNEASCSSGSGFADAALKWRDFGFDVMPIVPNTKLPAVTWDSWLQKLSPETIAAHWVRYPDHELGFIVGDAIVVFDADSAASITAMTAIERRFGIMPNMVVRTRKGEHHYFLRASGTLAKCDSHSTDKFPERIDIKAGRALVILPPSTGKSLAIGEAKNAGELIEVGQDFIDAVFLHNGRPLPRPTGPTLHAAAEPKTAHLRLLKVILRHLDADCGYDDWIHTGMALHYETGGSEEGLTIFDGWSRTGKKYKGPRETEAKWLSFKSDLENHFSIATLFWIAGREGFSRETILAAFEPFDTCEGENGTS